VIGGNSLGGWTALELAKRRRARAVVALSPAGFAEGWENAAGRFQLMSAWRGARLRRITKWMMRRPATRTLAFASVMTRGKNMSAAAGLESTRNLAESIAFENTVATLTRDRFRGADQVDVPVTLVWGTRDFVLFPWQAKRALRELPNARHVPLPGAGHVPTWDDPEAIVRELLSA
jgi:pimeloyl-ACP methyl ester carboxylesterase